MLKGGRRHALVSAACHQHRAKHGAGDNAQARTPEPLCQRTVTSMRTAIPLQCSRHGTPVGCTVARVVLLATGWLPNADGPVGKRAHDMVAPRRTTRDEPPMLGGRARAGPPGSGGVRERGNGSGLATRFSRDHPPRALRTVLKCHQKVDEQTMRQAMAQRPRDGEWVTNPHAESGCRTTSWQE
jgi:hypothetical protein